MARPYPKLNEVENTLASSFDHGTDVTMVLTSAADFSPAGGYVRVDDDAEWALYQYTAISTNTLTGLTLATLGNVESTASHTFAGGSAVERVVTAEDETDSYDDAVMRAFLHS